MNVEKQLTVPTPGTEPKKNPYYLHISFVYRLLKWGTLLLFAFYLVLMLVLCRDSITYENLMYLIRDLNISTGAEGVFADVVYEEQQNMRFSSYQNSLAVAGSSGLRLYDSKGSAIFTDGLAYTSPVLESGDKYLLLYDAGGREYTLFTSLSRVEQRTTENIIQHASISDSGAYCIVTRSDEAKYEITLYNSSFIRTARVYRDSYVISSAIHPDGSEAAVLSTSYTGSTISSEVMFCQAPFWEPESISLQDSLPLGAFYMANGNLAVICDNGVYYLTGAEKQKSFIPFSGETLSYFSVSDNKTALVCQRNILGSSSRILVLDAQGNVLLEEFREEKVIGLTASSGSECAYVLFEDHVEVLSVANGAIVPYSGRLLTVREVGGIPVLCFAERAETLQYSKNKNNGGLHESDS